MLLFLQCSGWGAISVSSPSAGTRNGICVLSLEKNGNLWVLTRGSTRRLPVSSSSSSMSGPQLDSPVVGAKLAGPPTGPGWYWRPAVPSGRWLAMGWPGVMHGASRGWLVPALGRAPQRSTRAEGLHAVHMAPDSPTAPCPRMDRRPQSAVRDATYCQSTIYTCLQGGSIPYLAIRAYRVGLMQIEFSKHASKLAALASCPLGGGGWRSDPEAFSLIPETCFT